MRKPSCDLLAVLPWMTAGGGERSFQVLATGLERQGYDVRAVVLHRDAGHFAPIFERWLIDPEPMMGRYQDVALRIAEYIDKLRPRSFLFHGWDIGAYAVNAAKHHPRTVMVKHTMWDADAEMCCRPHVQAAVDTYVCVSEACADHLIAHGIRRDKVRVIRNGVDDAGLLSAPDIRAKLGIDKEALVVVHAGRLCDKKGSVLVLEAALCTGCDALFIGWGDDLSQIRARAAACGSTKIRVFGVDLDIWRFLKSADLMVLPTAAEGAIPYILVESLLAGCAVACTRVADIPRLLRQGRHYIPIVRTVPSIVRAIEYAREMGREGCRQMAKAALTVLMPLTDPNVMVEQYVETLGLR